jgi:signal peptidase II
MAKVRTYPAYIVMSLVIILDQVTKALVRYNIPLYSWINVGEKWFADTFQICHLQNSGAAFSLSLPNPLWNKWFFIVVSIVAIIFILWLLHQSTNNIQVIAFGLVLGGAVGNNLIDRPIFGAVTDFISVDIPNIIKGMDRFPVFNVADSAIFIGMCPLIYDLIFISGKKIAKKEAEPLSEINDKVLDKEL